MKVLVLNAGSSSQKTCLYYIPDDDRSEYVITELWSGSIDWSKQDGLADLKVESNGIVLEETANNEDRLTVIKQLFHYLCNGDTAVLETWQEIDFVGHRVVHGGREYQQPTWINEEVKSAIAQLASLAPSHNPVNLQGIELMEQLLPDTPQVAVFDTAFHSQIPPEAAIYPLPYRFYEDGIRRYGFHGISHQYCAEKVAKLLKQPLERLKLITCHLGNGASLAAIKNGHSIDTSMGFTPLEGLMMGTRCGSIDPGIVIHLLREQELTPEQVDKLLNKESGLKGISGISGDMRRITKEMEKGDDRAQLAFDSYVHHLVKGIASMFASLGRVDALVFTAGVGENSAVLRQAVCEKLEFLGIELDSKKNENSPRDEQIASIESSTRIFVIHTDEDSAIAQAVSELAQGSSKTKSSS